jgi:hypothetical protein
MLLLTTFAPRFLFPCAVANAAYRAVKPTLLIFPFDRGEGAVTISSTMGPDLADAIKFALTGSRYYDSIVFTDRLPTVRRSLEDGAVRKDDVVGPFAENMAEKALKLGRLMSADLVLVGSYDDFKHPDNQAAGMTLNVQVFDVNTAKQVKMIAVTGQSSATAKRGGEDEYAALAAADAVNKIVKDLTPDPATGGSRPVTYAPAPRNSSGSFWTRKSTIAVALLLGIAAAVLATRNSGGGSSSGGGGGGDNPPPGPF